MEKSLEKQFLEDILKSRGIIVRICMIYRKDRADRDDLYQEIIMNAWNAYPRFKGLSKFSTWLYKVALNTALSENRKNKFFGLLSDLDHLKNRESIENTNEDTEMLYFAIEQLDPLEKSIALLYLDDLPYKEISEITGLTESNIGVRLNRLKSKIKSILINYKNEK
jgi:RNA polymerase sigma-70 factor (ECF subfamily)